jgi:tetratricopeptide (TPR) repeat protein
MISEPELPAWKPELDAIVGARHGGQVEHVLGLLQKLDGRFPHVAEIAFQLAWTHDVLTQPREARPHYERAIALGLAANELAGALIGLGSTWRSLGEPARAAEILRAGRTQFPNHREFDIFLALALHDLGDHTAALQLALTALVETSDDPGVTAYQRTIRFQAVKLGGDRK